MTTEELTNKLAKTSTLTLRIMARSDVDHYSAEIRELAIIELARRIEAGEAMPVLATLGEEDRAEALRAQGERIERRGRKANNPILTNIVTADPDDDLPPLIKNGEFVITDYSVLILYGLYGVGKSMLAEDLGCTLATGLPWLGREDGERNYPMGVLYVQTEGPQSQVASRIQAWRMAHPDAPDPMERLTHVRPYGFDWADKKIAYNLSKAARDEEIRAHTVIIDTLDAGRPTGGNMNDEEVGNIFANVLPALAYEAELSVIVVAHANAKDESIAGLSRQANAAENIIHVKRRGEHRVAILEKNKDVAGQPEILFDIVDSPHSTGSGPVGVVQAVTGATPKSAAGKWMLAHLTMADAADNSRAVKSAGLAAGFTEKQIRDAREEVADVVRLSTGETVWVLRSERA